MTGESAHKVVLIVGGLMTAYVLLQGVRDPAGRYRQLWAVGALTLGLSAVADFAPELAGPFALLVLVAAAARNRGVIGQLLGPSAQPVAAKAPAAAHK